MKRAVMMSMMLNAICAMGQNQSAPVSAGMAQPKGASAEVNASYNRLKENILKAAEKMPAGDYQFKGTPEIRTYARVVNHITEAQQHTCTALNGSKIRSEDGAFGYPLTRLQWWRVCRLRLRSAIEAYAGLKDADLMRAR